MQLQLQLNYRPPNIQPSTKKNEPQPNDPVLKGRGQIENRSKIKLNALSFFPPTSFNCKTESSNLHICKGNTLTHAHTPPTHQEVWAAPAHPSIALICPRK